MDKYKENLEEEIEYLDNTLEVITNELEKAEELLETRKYNMLATRKDMWENSAHFSTDFDKLTEMNQQLTELNNQTEIYTKTLKMVERYKKILKSPYFGRFDFKDDESGDAEKIYIGLYNVTDTKTFDILIYDWRAPIASIFYQFELGNASYKSPEGEISGKVLLKRQYKIENSKFKYFFDCNVNITDELLQEVLSGNTSPKMRVIVETIQKDQDIIIRDTDNELLVVQGVAGSGKTSIALHRIAYLLYEGMHSNFGSNNVLIISPNAVFSKYISSVLPDLGEENVKQKTFDELLEDSFGARFSLQSRSSQIEALILSNSEEELDFRKQSIEFKGSKDFALILKRLIQYYERQMIPIEDIYYNGKIIQSKQEIKNLLLNNKINMPLSKRLKRIESIILEKLQPLHKSRLGKIEEIVSKNDGHEFEIKPYSRLLSIKENNSFLKKIQRFTEVDYFYLFKILFNNKELFLKLSHGIKLPSHIEEIIKTTRESLDKGEMSYEDYAPLLYLKLKIEGNDSFVEIKQVVIDEAQDYYPMQYEIFKQLFKGARYTVLGDVNQTIEKDVDKSIYDEVTSILAKKRSIKIFLNKGYRSSFEINMFNQKLLDKEQDFIAFERHELEPLIIGEDTLASMEIAIAKDIGLYLEQGFESIAVICKTQEEAEKLHGKLSKLTNVKLLNTNNGEIEKGILVIPTYIAKGLEFDVVLVYEASKVNYSTRFDKKLLYIACTRALHRLVLYHTGEKSLFI